MSSKLLYNLSEENPNLNKQFGCMNGIFQVFYRQHYPARPVAISGDEVKSLPPGDRRDIVGEINMESEKETERSIKKKKYVAKEKHRVSSESSSRPSYSSSPRSSSFSSAEVSTTDGSLMKPYDLKELVKGSINKELVSAQQKQHPNSARTSFLLLKESSPYQSSIEWNERRGMTLEFKESHRLSYDEREMRNNSSKLRETPRLSLDSRSNSFKNSPEEPSTMSHRRSHSSVVAKLMGLEVIGDNLETEQRREKNRFCDSPRPISRVEPTALDSIKKIPPASAASKFPMEPAPWKQRKDLTVYGEIQKRLTQLEFKKSGKDLRALKQILEAMEKTQQLMDGNRDNTHQPVLTSAVVTKPVALVPISLLPQNVPLPNVKVGNNTRQTRKVASGKQSAMDLTPRPGLYKGQTDSTNSPKTLSSRQAMAVESCSVITKSGRSKQQSVSLRTHPKRQSLPTTPKQEPDKIRRQLGKKQTDSVSPRRKQGMKPQSSTLQQLDDRLSDASSDLRSLRSDSNISLRSNVDIKSPDFGIKQDRSSSLKPLKVTVEHSSPVSVLDAAFYEEDSPSPVRKISLSFKEDNALRSDESEWINKPTGFCRSILLPQNNRDPTQQDSVLPDENKYISEILLASGLLRDLDYSMISIQLHQTRFPINPGLFYILEQNKDNNKHKGRGFRQQETNKTEKLKRKLIFDTVNELLAQKFAAEGCINPQHLPANSLKISKEEQLLQTLCWEIDRLQQNNSKCNSKGFEGETPGIVLDIERMIFRDLVNEVCF